MRTKENKYKNRQDGITLITLLITIILLIIIASIVINISLRKNGLFSKVKEGKLEYSEAVEKEKLQTVLVDAIIIKETQESFDKETTLNEMLKKENMRSTRKYSNSRKL